MPEEESATGAFDERIVRACDAVLSVVAGRESVAPISEDVLDEWWNASDDEVEAVMGFKVREPFWLRLELAFLHAQRTALDAKDEGDSDTLRLAHRSLIDGCWYVSQSYDTPEPAQQASLLALAELLKVGVHPRRRHYQRAVGEARLDGHTVPQLADALGISWDTFLELAAAIRTGVTIRRPDAADLPAPDLSTTADVVLATPLAGAEVVTPDYDKSDQDRRVRSVRLNSFRGSPGALSLDFLKNDRPVSALVLGDNGVGKSTLADAVEFGLQGRVGRSVAFDSPLGPAAASFAGLGTPEVVVVLDDHSEVIRRLVKRPSGPLVTSSGEVRPGFRLAPIALKRQDILRFLDTDALARGHVFFDYFPESALEMAVRPEERLNRLADENYQLRIQRTHLAESLAVLIDVEPDELANRDRLLAVVRERFTGGETLDKARKNGSWETVDPAVRKLVEQLLGATGRLSAIKKERERGVETLNPARYRTQAALLGQILHDVGDEVTTAFRAITGASHVERIDVVFGRSGPVALDIVVQLSNGTRCFPQQLFSEGYRDLLAILFFAAVAQRAASHGQAKVLILDDVFQSVDATVRSGTVEYLLQEFKDWQLIFTVHDRLWFEQLRGAFSRHQHPFVERELRRWTFSGGPTLVTNPSGLTTALEAQLTAGEPADICGSAGRLLEQACDHLCWRLQASVTRRAGDKYTLGDLWPGVAKALKRTTLGPTCARIDSLYSLRNLAGAHYNQWAESLSLAEAEEFGEAVLGFVRATWCATCCDWVAKNGGEVRCRCGHLTV